MNENIVQLFNTAKSVIIVIAKNAKLDGMAAGLGLYLALIKEGKSARISTEASPQDMDKLVAHDKVTGKFEQGGNTLKVSFPYADGNIDKVTYNITDDRFNLLIEPRQGAAPLKNTDVQYSYTGAEVDLIVTVDAPNLEALGNIYLDNPDVFVREKIVNLDRRFDNQQYGAQNLVEKQFSSTSEIVVKVLEGLHWDVNPDIATNLYTGLVSATNNFTSFSTNAQSFEVASFLLKNGARKLPLTPAARPTVPGMGMNPSQPFGRFQAPGMSVPQTGVEMPTNQNIFQQGSPQPVPVKEQPKAQPQENKPEPAKEPDKKPAPPKEDKKQPPQDWLKPKIFKSTDLI